MPGDNIEDIVVSLWGMNVGALSWDQNRQVGQFQYFDEFIETGLEVAPLTMPLSTQVYEFPELQRSTNFHGLPGLIADSLPEKFGNKLLNVWLAKKGLKFSDLSPVERLAYLGSRGMGALEFYPDNDNNAFDTTEPIAIDELASIANDIVQANPSKTENIHHNSERMHKLISVGTSAGGAKAKAVIAINDNTNDIVSGQSQAPDGFTHWLLKFDAIENEELATSTNIGRIEMAYHLMAIEAGINMMPCRLLPDGEHTHFMTQRFDRGPSQEKFHVQTLCAIDHADRDPPGMIGYERLFAVARKLGLGQADLNEIYRRMVFNILSRNQDDHSKNHAFVMGGNGDWHLSPAYDICYSYKPGNKFIESHQMSCNGKRDNFELNDLMQAAKAADVKAPQKIIQQVAKALAQWPQFSDQVGLPKEQSEAIQSMFRLSTAQ